MPQPPLQLCPEGDTSGYALSEFRIAENAGRPKTPLKVKPKVSTNIVAGGCHSSTATPNTFIGSSTTASDRTPAAVFLGPPNRIADIPEYTRETYYPSVQQESSATDPRFYARRRQLTIPQGELFAAIFDDGPRMVRATMPVPYRLARVRVRWSLFEGYSEKWYARIDREQLCGKQWAQFVDVPADRILGVLMDGKQRNKWEFVDARPPGYHADRRRNEVAFLEMLVHTEIDWEKTEWLIYDDA